MKRSAPCGTRACACCITGVDASLHLFARAFNPLGGTMAPTATFRPRQWRAIMANQQQNQQQNQRAPQKEGGADQQQRNQRPQDNEEEE